MAVEIKWAEDHSEDSVTIEAIVDGPTDRAGLYSDLVANIPWDYDGLVFSKVENASLIEGRTDLWNCRLKYAAFREKQELKSGESEFRFNSANRSVTKTFSISSTVWDATGDVTSETSDARVIGYNEQERKADGTTVTEYINAFSWKVAVPFSTASETWRRNAAKLKGSICDTSFFGYPEGEVLFKDLTGGVKGDELYVFNLEFLQGENPGDITIGGIDVEGVEFWEILDIDDQELIEENGIIVPKVRRVKVHQMQYKKSWSLLTSILGMS